ncbi:MFS transporter [Yinghuangia soli]|uniref:MFS transporter n=1 Tax=Yinghuangia soli TaxID=2908204 RepID=A0AA41U5K2_9ACTN|nr:MFS transporter [Yinghuangia soli]MCF2532022.1 MFS transporter [Yinghuangia soli]
MLQPSAGTRPGAPEPGPRPDPRPAAAVDAAGSSPWRVRDFRTLFAASAFSLAGANIAAVAVPLIAVLALDAGPGQVGALAALDTAAFLLIGLPAGAWVDRLPHRGVLIAADVVRAALFASVPIAWWCGVLTLWQLFAVVLLSGAATVFFNIAAQSVLPSVVGRAGLVQANTALVTLQAAGSIGGRGAGGGVVQLFGAPAAALCTVAGYLGSAWQLARMRYGRAADPTAGGPAPDSPAQGSTVQDSPATGGSAADAPAVKPARPRLRTDVAEGMRHVFGSPELRALVLTAMLTNFGAQFANTMMPLVFTDELGLSAGALGLYLAVGGAGVLAGARAARPVARRLGFGRTIRLAGLVLAPAALLIPLVGTGPAMAAAVLGWFLTTARMGVDNVLGVSLRQARTPDALLGRMNATFHFVLTGAVAVGAAVSGAVGELASPRAALWAGAVFMAVAFVPVFRSPIRHLTALPAAPSATSSPAPAAAPASDRVRDASERP